MDSIFFRISQCFCCLMLMFTLNSFKGLTPKEVEDIQKKVNEARNYIEKNDQVNYDKGIALLNDFEAKLNYLNNDYKLLRFYRATIEMFLECHDFDSPIIYIKKGFAILNKKNDLRERGLFYECLAVTKDYQCKYEESARYYLLSEALLNKYGSLEENIDVNYNLMLMYYQKRYWKNSILSAQKALKNIVLTKTKEDRRIFINIFLARNYLNINQLDSVCYFIKKTENDSLFKLGNSSATAYYFQIKGLYLIKIGALIEGSNFLKKSNLIFQNLYLGRTKEMHDIYKLNSSLKVKEVENRRIKNEIKLKNTNIVYKNYIIFLGLFIISILITLATVQYRNSKFKTKVNLILRRNNRQLNSVNKELKVALKIKKNFLDTVTHELKTPLNTINGISYLLKTTHSERKKNEYLTTLDFSSNYLLGLIDNIIDYNMLDKSNEKRLHNRVCNLKSIIASILDTMNLKNDNQNDIAITLADEIPEHLLLDDIRFTQVIVNLMNNSMKFTKKGVIQLSLALTEINDETATIFFEISDTGIGIPKDKQEQVFEPFVQGSETINRDYGGSGIGLSVVKKNLALFGSNVCLESEEGVGTKISFEIKFMRPEIEENSSDLDSYTIQNPLDEKIEVLLVEDNKINQLITKKIIVSKGFNCDVANDGLEAVEMVKNKDYSILLMDIMMPNMDGFEASSIISKSKPYIPIVALTAISENIHNDEFEKSNIKMKLNKPSNVEELYQVILKYAYKRG